jgi:hypothetical protein
MSEPIIKEFGPEVLLGMPGDYPPIKMTGWPYKGATVWEEVDPIGTQHLKAEDIIEKLKSFPDYLSRPVRYVILSPFSGPNECVGEKTWASCNYEKAQITFFMQPFDREFSKRYLLSNKLALQHEIGHIIGGNLIYRKNFNKSNIGWIESMCLDSKIERVRSDLPKYYVSRNAEKAKSEFDALLEDIADSVAQYSEGNNLRNQLKENYPNRYKILEVSLK